MTTINYNGTKIKLEDCHKIEMMGSRYQIEHKFEKNGQKQVSFVELDRIDDMEEVAKVDAYVHQHNIDVTPKRRDVKEISDAKKQFFAERAALRLQQAAAQEARIKALENEIKKLKETK